jgi:hypothetical protein
MLLCCFVTGLVPLAAGCGGGVASETTVSVKRDKGEAGPGEKTEDGAGPAGGAPASGFGSFKGRVVFQGNAPSLPLILKAGDQSARDAAVCAAVDLPNERLVLGSGNGVANVFVYLAKAPAGAKLSPPPSEPAVFDQKGCRFIPHALLVRAKQKVLILSDDSIAHNTHTFPSRNTSFNQTINPKERNGVETVYMKQENNPIEVKCDFHAWMIAYHLPVDHPFAALTGPDGSFEIKDLPAGTHKFLAWHEGCSGGYLTRTLTVSIKAGEETTQEIPYAADKLK